MKDKGFLVLVLFFVLACIFYYPIFLGKIPFNGNLLIAFWSPWKHEKFSEFPTSVPFKYMGVDEVREFFPILDFTYESIRNGNIPLWNPYNFSGYPHLANWAAAVFYPLHLMIFFLTKVQTFIFLKLSAIVLSGMFTYLYLRAIALDGKSALFGGLAFAFSAPMLIWGAEIWQSVHSVLWLPLILFAIEKVIKTKKIYYMILGSFALAASIMGGYIQPSIYVLIVSIAYAIFRAKIFEFSLGNKKLLSLIIGMFVFGFGFSAIHTIPAIEFFQLSPRKEIALTNVNLDFLIPLSHAVTFFVPDIFGHVATKNWFAQQPGQYYEQLIFIGVVPLLFIFFSLFQKKLRNHAIFFLIVGLFSLSTVFDLSTSRFVYLASLPFISSAIAIRIIFIVAFCFSVLSAFGFSWWFAAQKKQRVPALFALLPLTLVYVGVFLWLIVWFWQNHYPQGFPPSWFVISLRNLVIPGFVFLCSLLLVVVGLFLDSLRKIIYFCLCLVLLIHAFIFAHKYFVFSEIKFLYPAHPALSYIQEHIGFSRFWGYGDGVLENNFATKYKVYSAEGYDPVNIRKYNELLSAANTGKFTNIASRSDALIPRTDFWPTQDSDTARLKLLDFLGVKYVIALKDKDKNNTVFPIKNERFKQVFEYGGFSIFENKKAAQRVFLVTKPWYVNNSKDALNAIFDEKLDLSKKVILEEKLPTAIPDERQGNASIVSYAQNKVIIRTITSSLQILVLSDNFYPGWEASIDGINTKIYRANYTFRAVLVPKGEHNVIFVYNPFSFRLGAGVSMVSILVITLIFVYNKGSSDRKLIKL